MKKLQIGPQYRQVESFEIRQAPEGEDNRTLDLTFSSETPVERFFGYEILDHSPESVDLRRMNSQSAPLLLNHDPRSQLGIVERAEIGGDRRGRATVRFGKSPLAQEIWQDVKDGIRRLISVGYRLSEAKLEKESKEGDTFRVTRWEPVELSIVSVPADYSIGIGRDAGQTNEFTITRSQKVMDELKEKKTVEPEISPVQASAAPAAPAADEGRIRSAEMKRFDEIITIGQTFNLVAEAQRAYREGKTPEQFKGEVLQMLSSKQTIDTRAASLDLSENEKKQYSFSRLLIALVNGEHDKAGFEFEVSRALAQKLNRKPQGVFVPHELLVGKPYTEFNKRDLTAGSGAASLVGTDHLAGSFIELLRNKIVVQQLGVLTLTGLSESVSIPRQTGAATAAWLATESTSVTPTDQSFDSVTLAPKNVAADTKISRQAILQANPSIEAIVMNDLISVLALAIDLGAINGSGASGQPTGILQQSGIGSVPGSSFSWEQAVELETDVAAANADLGSMWYLTNASVRGILKTRPKDAGSGLFLMEGGNMNGYPVAVSNQVPSSTIIFGSFNQLIMGFWGVLDLLVNPYLFAATRYVAIHATQSVDVAVRHAASFSASTDVD